MNPAISTYQETYLTFLKKPPNPTHPSQKSTLVGFLDSSFLLPTTQPHLSSLKLNIFLEKVVSSFFPSCKVKLNPFVVNMFHY